MAGAVSLFELGVSVQVAAASESDQCAGGLSGGWWTEWWLQVLRLVQGFCIGGALQGLKYKDWANVWYVETKTNT